MYEDNVDELKSAMASDAFLNDSGSCRVSEQDVSDCPQIDDSKAVHHFEQTEDFLQDALHEVLISELMRYA